MSVFFGITIWLLFILARRLGMEISFSSSICITFQCHKIAGGYRDV